MLPFIVIPYQPEPRHKLSIPPNEHPNPCAYLALPVGSVPQLNRAVVRPRSQPARTVNHGVDRVGVVVQRTHQAPRVGVPHLGRQA